MPREPIRAPLAVNVLGSSLAGFQVTLIGRIWVTLRIMRPSDRVADHEVVRPVPAILLRVSGIPATRLVSMGQCGI
jgi:hypothetical protein